MLSSKKSNYPVSNTVIGEEILIESSLLKGSGTIRIDGQYIGEINIDGNIIVGEKGLIKGNISTNHLLVAGTIEGDIICENEIHLSPTAKIIGNITSSIVVIDEGAVFNGNCTTSKKSGEFDVVNITDRTTSKNAV